MIMAASGRRFNGFAVFVVLFVMIIWYRYSHTSNEAILPTPDGKPVHSDIDDLSRSSKIVSLRQKHSVTLVVAKSKEENTDWIQAELPGLNTAIYVCDDPEAALTVPKNKGNEAMAYLTYIIDNYDNLPDISIFTHAHKSAWHNNGFLGDKAGLMIERLNGRRVIAEGYVNLRCEWDPGCPRWVGVKKFAQGVGAEEREVTTYRKAWAEIHPDTKMPAEIGAPCCAQFAVSNQRIQGKSLEQWKKYRTWLLDTKLSDGESGRVWEYMWHYVFTGQGVKCPDPYNCYCDGFGVCFGSHEKLNDWVIEKKRHDGLVDEYLQKKAAGEEAPDLKKQIDSAAKHLQRLVTLAIKEGDRFLSLVS